jgi:hypothetical protein
MNLTTNDPSDFAALITSLISAFTCGYIVFF